MQCNFLKGSSIEEQANTNQTKCSPRTDLQEPCKENLKKEIPSKSSKENFPKLEKEISNSVRGGARKPRQTSMGSCEGFIGEKEHQSNKVWGTEIARTLDASEYKHPMKILDE